jgi:hypothetical protein
VTPTPDRIADYSIKIAFSALLSNNLHFSNLDKFFGTPPSPVFTNNFSAAFTGVFDDVTLDVAEGSTVTVSRGQDAKFSSIQAGQASFELINIATPSLYDPNDPSSPLVAGVEFPGLVPMRPVQIQATPYVLGTGGTPLGLFYGFLRTASFDPETKVCSIECEDLLYWFGRVNAPVIPVQTGITSTAAVQLLLNAIGWTDPSMVVLEPLPAIQSMTFSSDGSTTALDLLQGILDAEQGYVFVDGNGAFHYEGRYARDNRRTALASFDELALIGLSSGLDADQIINQVTVTAEAGGGGTGTGTAQVANDVPSQQTNGISGSSEISSPYLPSDKAASDLANLLLLRSKNNLPPQQAIVDNATSALLAAMLALNPQDRVNVGGGSPEFTYVNLVKAFLPKLYWRLGETVGAGTAADASGNGNTGTYGSGVTLGQTGLIVGDPDTAAAFNNTANAKITSAYKPFVVGSQRTFFGWANRTATTDTDTLFADAAFGVSLRIGSGNEDVTFNMFTPVTWAAAWPGTGVTVFWALVYDDVEKTAELFINGVSQGAKLLGAGYTGTETTFQVGLDASGFAFNGKIDEVAVCEYAISAAGINAIYQTGIAASSGVDCFVESVQHQIKAGGLYQSTTIGVSRAPATRVFEFGVSTFGSTDYFG